MPIQNIRKDQEDPLEKGQATHYGIVGQPSGSAGKESTFRRFLKKLEIELPYDPAIPLLGIHTKENQI